MPNEEPKPRRTRSTSLTAQVNHDDSGGSGTDEVFHSKRVKISSIIIFWTVKLLRFLLQRAVTFSETILRSMSKCRHRYHGNIKWFLQNYPPMVLFTLAICFFALLLTSLAFYVSRTKLSKVDVSQDWNMFLQGFSDLEFCIIHDNSTTKVGNVLDRRAEHPVGKDIRSYSITMSVTIYPTKEFVSVPHSMMHLSASMGGKYIGLKGDESQQRLNVTIVVPYSWNASSCSNNPLHGCQTVELELCIQLTGPIDLFPVSNRRPKSCPAHSLTNIDYWAMMNWQLGDVDSLYYCRSRTMIDIQHVYDPSLFQPLKKPHRSVIRQHLLHTSFFLYIFVAVMFAYAAIFNHAKQARMSQLETPVGMIVI